MSEKRARPPTWREVVGVLLAIEERLDHVLETPRLPLAVRAEIAALLTTEVRPLLRRAAR